MKAVDIVSDGAVESITAKFAKRLGFDRISAAKDAKRIVVASGIGAVVKSVRDRDVMGFIFEDSTLVRKAVEMIRENEKLVIIPVSALMQEDARGRIRSLNRARRLYKFAAKSRAGVKVVSMARDREHLLSSMQLIEIAKLLGAPSDDRAKEMLLGGD